MLDRLEPEDRDAVVRAACWTMGLAAVGVVVLVLVLAAPAPLGDIFEPIGYFGFIPAGVALLWTLVRYLLAVVARDR